MSYQLNTSDSSISVHMNSEDATSFVGVGRDSGLVQTSDFIVIMDDILTCDPDQNMLLSVQSVEVPTSYYNVSAAIGNNRFQFKEGSGLYNTITLPSKNYDVDDVCTDLVILLNSASSVSATYTMTYDLRTLKFTVTSSSATAFTFEFSNNKATAKLLGFFPTTYTSSNQTLTSQTPANMNSIPFAFLETNFSAEGSIITSSATDQKTFRSGVLLKIPLNNDFASIMDYQPINKHTLIINRKRFRSLRFTLKDAAFNTIDMNGVPISLTMTIDFMNFEAGGVYGEPERNEELKMTRDDVNELLTQSLMQQGDYHSKQADQRNRFINLLDLGKK